MAFVITLRGFKNSNSIYNNLFEEGMEFLTLLGQNYLFDWWTLEIDINPSQKGCLLCVFAKNPIFV